MGDTNTFEYLIKATLDAAGFKGTVEGQNAIIAKVRETTEANKALAASEEAITEEQAKRERIRAIRATQGNVNINDESTPAKGDFTGGETRQVDMAAVAAQQAEAEAAMAAAQEKRLANLAREEALKGEILAIESARKELISASAAGDVIKVEMLRTEIAARQLTVTELGREVESAAELSAIEEGQAAFVAESMQIIEQRVAARQLELETMQAQEELNEQLIAQEEARIAFEKTIAELSAKSAEGHALGGINIAKARNEATTLVRELSTGASTTRTFGALLGSLGPELGIAGIAAFVLYEQLKKVPEVMQAISDALAGVNGGELAKSIQLADQLNEAFKRTATEGSKQIESSIEHNGNALTEMVDKYRIAWEASDTKQMASLRSEIAQKAELIQMEDYLLKVARDDEAIEKDKAQDAKDQAQAAERISAAGKEAASLDQQYQEHRERGLNLVGKRDAEQDKADSAKSGIEGYGVKGNTPDEVFNNSIGMPDEQRNRVVELVVQWQEAIEKVKQYNDELTKAKEEFRKHLTDAQKKQEKDKQELQDKKDEEAASIARAGGDDTKANQIEREIQKRKYARDLVDKGENPDDANKHTDDYFKQLDTLKKQNQKPDAKADAGVADKAAALAQDPRIFHNQAEAIGKAAADLRNASDSDHLASAIRELIEAVNMRANTLSGTQKEQAAQIKTLAENLKTQGRD